MPHVSVIIDGKTYRMACNDGQEEHLRSLGDKMDQTIQQLKENFGEIGDQRLAVMAGIMMADEASEHEVQIKGLQAEIASLKESRTALVDRYQGNEETLTNALTELTDRIAKLTAKLNGSTSKPGANGKAQSSAAE